jgi:hypothetical protein
VRHRVYIFISITAILAVGVIYDINQPSLECKSLKVVVKADWDSASTANSLSTNQFLSGLFGDLQNPESELKYNKSLYELQRIEHLYKISASKRTLENRGCFSETEISNAQVEAKVQESFEGYFAE